MSRTRACSTALLAGIFAATGVASGAPGAGAVSDAFDVDDVAISGSRAKVAGTLAWSRSGVRPGTSAKLTGRLSTERGCARLEVDWLNSGTGTLDSSTQSTCADVERFVLRFRHASLECARIRLFVSDEQTGPTRLLCAGGS